MRRTDIFSILRWGGLLLGIAVPIAAAFATDVLTGGPLTLDQYFAAAMKRSEVVATQSELIRQAEERYEQANGGVLPTLSGTASYLWQDPIPAGELTTANSPNRQRLAKVTATQPLFRGFREFAGIRQQRALVGAQNEDYQNARIQLFKDVAQNFYNVLSLEQDAKTLREQIAQNLTREKELNDRVRIGRSRVGEVLSVQTTVSTQRAELEQLQTQLQTAREVFAFLSGLPASTPLRDSEELPSVVAPLDDYLAQLDTRPDVKAGRQRITAAQENVSVARGAHLPSLDLNANRYFERSGALRDVAWDVQLALTVPIYSGGQLQSRVREAASQQTQAELGAGQVRRLAEQEIRALHQGVDLFRSQVDALEKARDAARKNYEAQLRDYRLGLVTNLDVLQSLTAYQENQRALDRARFNAKLNYLKLQAATARRPAAQEGNAP